jgi:hypothetical protein
MPPSVSTGSADWETPENRALIESILEGITVPLSWNAWRKLFKLTPIAVNGKAYTIINASTINEMPRNLANFLKDLDDGKEHIYMKCELITIKSLFGRKSLKKRVRINIFSLSDKKIYTKDFLLEKIKLLEK